MQAVTSDHGRTEKRVQPVMKSRRFSSEEQRRSSTEQKRRSSSEETKYSPATEETWISALPEDPANEATLHETLTEDDRDLIKTSFDMVESLWRDISMGSEFVLSSVLASIQENLGEFGSELFKEHFMISNNKQEWFFL